MALDRLSSRAVIGMFYDRMTQNIGSSWINAVGMYFSSDQSSEEYPWLGNSPMMQEWKGSRQGVAYRETGIVIKNVKFEATVRVELTELERDKSGQLEVRIAELADTADAHWAKILSEAIVAGESTPAYDGQFFYDVGHQFGNSGIMSNKITTDISTLGITTPGIVTIPSVETAQQCIMRSISQFMTFKDDQGEPINESATKFLVMEPVPFFMVFNEALTMPRGTGVTELHKPNEFEVRVVTNPRLPWVDKFVTFIDGMSTTAFIRQEEKAVNIKAKAEGSDYEFDNDAHEYGVDSRRNVGNARWERSVMNTLV